MKKAIVLPALLYAAVCIISITVVFYAKLFHILNMTYLLSLLVLLPSIYFTIRYYRNNYTGGLIGGKEAVKVGLQFVLVAVLIMAAFQAIFFVLDFKEFKINYINTVGPEVTKAAIKNGVLKAKESEIPKILQQEIEQITLSGEMKVVFLKYLIYGLFSSFISSIFLKRVSI